jgi:hypothetical protein
MLDLKKKKKIFTSKNFLLVLTKSMKGALGPYALYSMLLRGLGYTRGMVVLCSTSDALQRAEDAHRKHPAAR